MLVDQFGVFLDHGCPLLLKLDPPLAGLDVFAARLVGGLLGLGECGLGGGELLDRVGLLLRWCPDGHRWQTSLGSAPPPGCWSLRGWSCFGAGRLLANTRRSGVRVR
jgi:hypothetical protein